MTTVRRNRLNPCLYPSGLLGKFILWTMNLRHGPVTDWGLEHVDIDATDQVLDVGCGGGKTIGKLAARASRGRVAGIDHSGQAVETAKRLNGALVDAGRVEIQVGSVSALPYADGAFDVVTAIETHFWWPDLPADMREVFRVVRPGGRLAVIAEFYGSERHAKSEKMIRSMGMSVLTAEEHRALLNDSGFRDVQIVEDRRRGWICALGTKPE